VAPRGEEGGGESTSPFVPIPSSASSEKIKSDPEVALKSLQNWRQLYLAVFRKSCDWSHVVLILDSFAAQPTRSPSMLSIARWRSLCLQDLVSFASKNKIGFYSSPSWGEGPRLDGSEDEDEEAYWEERENAVTQAYPSLSILPLDTAYFPLQLLKADRSDKRFDVLCCLPSVDTADSSPSLASRRPSALEDLDSSLKKFSRVAQEMSETERLFVRDMGKLVLLLTELRYSTLASVRAFCQSVPFTAIFSSATVLHTLHTEFLNRIESLALSTDDTDVSAAALTDLRAMESLSRNLFSALRLYSPLFPLLAQYVVHHDSFSSLYNSHMVGFEDFHHFLSNCERAMGETMASLIIKPVQRLPRYVLLCQEMKKILSKAEELFVSSSEVDDEEPRGLSEERQGVLRDMVSACEEVCRTVSSAAHSCNELVRSHQDTLRMHELHDMLLLGGSHLPEDLPVVVKERRFVKEGDLFRHHRNSAMRLHRLQLFTDVLLSSAPSTAGSSSALYLEQHITLTAGSGTFCLPIPSPSQHQDPTPSGTLSGSGSGCTHWFLLASAHKNLYFGSKSEAEVMRWVEAIQRCLTQNRADRDDGKSQRQLELINSLLREMETERREARETAAEISLQEFQSCWWQLLASPAAAAASPSLLTIARQLRQHAKEVASHLILTVLCDEQDLVDGKSPVTALLFTDQPHYLIASGLFFEYPRSSASIASGERPSVVRVFLFHDLLLAAYCSHVDTPLTYAFHIPLSSLRCSDYRNGVGELAILLADTSPQRRARKRSILGRIMSLGEEAVGAGSGGGTGTGGGSPGGQEVRRVLFAATIAMKFDWLSLLMQSIAATGHSPEAETVAAGSSLPAVRGRISLELDPLHPLWIEEPSL
jgi:hypothetical protein